MKGENSKIRILAAAAMVSVTAVTTVMVRDFMAQAQAGNQARGQTAAEAARSQADLPEGNSHEGMEAGGVPERTEADYAAALAYAESYAGEWNVEKYFNGKEWKIYEFGKRMAILAYNFLNDISFTTGGYDKFAGYDPIKDITYVDEAGYVHRKRVTGTDPVDGYLDDTDVLLDNELIGMTPIYEYVPEVTHRLPGNGEDIEYSTPSITLSGDGVDMSGMGGPIFGLAMFRVETIDGQEYLINDYFRFAITRKVLSGNGLTAAFIRRPLRRRTGRRSAGRITGRRISEPLTPDI